MVNDYEGWLEDNAAWFSRGDRFDGFDRGDPVPIHRPPPGKAEPWADMDDDIPF